MSRNHGRSHFSIFRMHQVVLVASWHGGGVGDGGGDGDAGGGDSATHWPQVSAQLVRIQG